MRVGLLTAVLLACIGLPPAAEPRDKGPAIDMANMKRIFVGWVKLDPETWSAWGYQSREEWANVIRDLNLEFARSCQGKYLVGRTVTGAKDESDENAADNDLYIKFSDVYIDHDYYGIRLSIQFIDPKTNAQVTSIPSNLYYQKRWFRFELYMRAALDEVGKKLQKEFSARSK